MTAYFDLTELLANAFSNADDWQRVPSNAGMATGSIVLQGSAIAAWANILKAALDQNRLEGLRERIAIERPEILPVFDRFAEEASKGPLDALDLPSLTNIQLRTEDLDSKKLLAALDFGVALPPTVWTIALSNGLPSRSIVDSALSHVNVGPAVARRDRFLLESSRALAPLKQRKDEVTKKLTTLQNQVSSVERTTRPYEPHPPSQLTSMSDDQRSYWSDRYSKEMDQYRKDVSSYATSQGTLPKLRQACDAVLGELRQVEAAIGAREAQTNAGVLPFSDDIERARDADMLLLLDGLTNSGLRAFDEGDPFKGFSVLLATGCVLEALLKIFVQPAAATEAGRRFGVATDTVSDAVRRDIAAIARRCLSGPTLVQIAMRRNNEAAAALLARLDGVPIARLEAGLDRAIGLLSQPLPKMPSLGEIEKPKELESLRQDLTSMRASMERHASEVRDELDRGGSDIRRHVIGPRRRQQHTCCHRSDRVRQQGAPGGDVALLLAFGQSRCRQQLAEIRAHSLPRYSTRVSPALGTDLEHPPDQGAIDGARVRGRPIGRGEAYPDPLSRWPFAARGQNWR